jgi:hypothetical protein
MKYDKPQISSLGSALKAVQSTSDCQSKSSPLSDSSVCGGDQHTPNPAYEADE